MKRMQRCTVEDRKAQAVVLFEAANMLDFHLKTRGRWQPVGKGGLERHHVAGCRCAPCKAERKAGAALIAELRQRKASLDERLAAGTEEARKTAARRRG